MEIFVVAQGDRDAVEGYIRRERIEASTKDPVQPQRKLTCERALGDLNESAVDSA